MKRIVALALIISLTLSLIITGLASGEVEYNSIKNYMDIPGITDEEIAAVEKLKALKGSFSYGHITETEAYELPDGTYTGFTYSFCDLLTELFDIEFVPKYYGSWTQLKNAFDNHETDFIGDLTSTPERMQIYYMTRAIAERSLRIYTMTGNDIIKTEADIGGLRIGFLVDTITADSVQKAYPIPFETVDIYSYADAAEKLKSGEIDAFTMEGVADLAFEDYDFIESRDFFPLVYTPVSMASASADFEAIISVVDKYLVAGGIDKLFELYEADDYEYIKYKLNRSLNDDEKAYLNNLKSRGEKVSLALEHDNYPVSFYNAADNEFQGIAVDVIKKTSSLLDIEFDVKTTKNTTWAEIMEKLKTGEISMVSQLLYSDARKDNFIWSSVPYATSYYALISKAQYPDLNPYQIIRAKVGNISKTAYEDMFYQWFPDSLNAVSYQTHNMALDALEKGEIDLLMASEYILLTQLNYREKSGFKINMRFSEPSESLFGFNKSEEILCSIINKTQPYVKTYDIARDWESRIFDYSKKLANERSTYLSILVVILLVVLIMVVFLLGKNISLSKSLEWQTATTNTIYSSIPDIVFSMDTNFIYTSCNTGFEKFVGQSKEHVLGKSNAELFTDDQEAKSYFDDTNRQVLLSQQTRVDDAFIICPDGIKRYFETITTPLFHNHKLIGLMSISRDITKHKATEEEAQIASKAKSSFLARMSHEIRTPLNAIIGMSGIAKKSIADHEKAITSINQIITSSNYLLGILNDVLDMSKIESGKLELMEEQFGLLEAYDEVSVIISSRCSEKNITFVTNMSKMKDCNLIGDKLRINQILINLLSNAAKFTPEGGKVEFTVTVLNETDMDILLEYSIVDSGIGMTSEQLSKLFLPFEQADSSIAAKYGGTGLGLSISQNLVNMMGGEIKVESKLGVGSKFCFCLLFQKGDPSEADSPDITDFIDLTGKRILLVEDIEINRIIIQEMFDTTGVEMDEAVDGQQAVDIFEDSPFGYYDFIFMDIQMPVLNGYEATKKIRLLPREDAKSVPIIALTANAYTEDVNEALSSGMNGHLAKPVDMDVLFKMLAKFI